MSTKSKSKPAAKKDTGKPQQPQGLLKKTGKNVMDTLSSVKSTIMGDKGAKGAKGKADGQKIVTNGVYVKGINHKQSLDDIKRVFEAAGPIKECRRRSDKFALIWFVEHNSVKKAIDMFHHKNIESVAVTGAATSSADLSINEKYRKHNPCLYSASKHSASTLSKYIVQPARITAPADRSTYCKTIFVSGLPNVEIVPNAILRAAFAKYGKVVKMARYSLTNFTFVYYADVASAVKAQKEIHNKGLANLFKNVKEEVKPAKKGADKKKEAKPFALPKADHPLHVELSVRTKERDDAREVVARKQSKHKEEHKKWVRGTGF